jgi:hypothetical protein
MRCGPRAVLLEIMAGVEALDADPGAKQKFRWLVQCVGAANGLQWIDRKERVDFARRLLDSRVSRPTIRDRLIATFEVSRPQAYRIIEAALETVSKGAEK